MNMLKEGMKLSEDQYVGMVGEYYSKYKKTTEVHIDTLILIYKLTDSKKSFDLIFKCHYFLLMKIVKNKYERYKGHLYQEDFKELQHMVFGEFFRRVMFYKIPPEAPFSKYVKLYLKNWLNTYTKIIVNKNKRFVLFVDWREEIE